MESLSSLLQELNLDPTATARITQLVSGSAAAASVEAARNDNLRTVAAILKPPKPKPYTGAVDAVECLNFLENQREYFELVELNPALWVKFTAVNLEGDAKSWWRDSGLSDISSWQEFTEAFTDYFTPPAAATAARQSLDKIKQGRSTVAEYTTKFRRLLRLLPKLDTESAIHLYTKGLEPTTSKEVRLRQPETLSQAIKQATIVHGILHPTEPTGLGTSDHSSTASTPTPMDLDALQVLISNLTSLHALNGNPNYNRSNHQNNNRTSQNRSRLGKLSDQERERLRLTGGCYRCRRPGHISRDCRVRINSIELDEDPESEPGKDSGEV